MSTARKRQPDLEKSLAELEQIVATLEEGDIPLEQALKQFEKGIKLSRDCQTALQSAEQSGAGFPRVGAKAPVRSKCRRSACSLEVTSGR